MCFCSFSGLLTAKTLLDVISDNVYRTGVQKVCFCSFSGLLTAKTLLDVISDLEYMELGRWFRKVDDPILLDFLKAWGKFEVEGQAHDRVIRDTIKEYDALARRFNDLKGNRITASAGENMIALGTPEP